MDVDQDPSRATSAEDTSMTARSFRFSIDSGEEAFCSWENCLSEAVITFWKAII